MSKLTFDAPGSRYYETGIDHVVLFVKNDDGTYANGVAWNGIFNISENPTGGDANDIYADNIKYLSLTAVEEFEATIEAYSRPNEFLPCDGFRCPFAGFLIGQQPRKQFGLYYRTRVMNDNGTMKYKHHLVWNATAGVSDRAYETLNDSPEPISFSWDITTVPVTETITPTGGTAKTYTTASLTINEAEATAPIQTKINALLDIILGTDPVGQTAGTNPTMPTLTAIYNALK